MTLYAVRSQETWVVVFVGSKAECITRAARLNLSWQTTSYQVEMAA